MAYAVTPTSSVDALHVAVSVGPPGSAVTTSSVGTDGAEMSSPTMSTSTAGVLNDSLPAASTACTWNQYVPRARSVTTADVSLPSTVCTSTPVWMMRYRSMPTLSVDAVHVSATSWSAPMVNASPVGVVGRRSSPGISTGDVAERLPAGST